MKKLLLCGAIAAGCCLTSAAQSSKINNVGRLQLTKFAVERAELAKAAPMRAAALAPNVNVTVTLTEGNTADDLLAAGYEVLDQTADMAIVALPITEVEALAELDQVKYIDFGYQAEPMMDVARELSFVTPVHAGGEGLPRAFKGNGVYVGLYDTGLDPGHINFTDGSGNTRVKGVYLVKSGRLSRYESASDIASFTTDTESESHGTHVLGIIAGREDAPGQYGAKEGNSVVVKEGAIPFYGVAPEASLLVGCGSFDTQSIQVGVGAVIDRAIADGKPVVVNLSLGHNRGAHDPRESSNKFLDSKAKDAIVVVSAGNEGGTNCSIFKNLKGSGGNSLKLNTFITPSEGAMSQTWYTAEFWGDSDQAFSTSLVLYNTATKKAEATLTLTGKSGQKVWKPSDNDVFKGAFTSSSSISVSWGVDNATGRYNVQLDNNLTSNGTKPIVFGVNITGTNGMRVDGYCDAYNGYSQSEVEFTSQSISGYTKGNDQGSINGMACGYNTISVGAWVSRTSMPTLASSNTSYTGAGDVGDIASFSSYGRSGDGRQLPVVCGPGAQIVSSVSRFWTNTSGMERTRLNAFSDANGRENPWYYMQGTSMSSPFVAGTIALWLEACPGLRAADALEIINKTSTPNTTGSKNRWGAGKINALEGLKEAIKLSASVKSVLADQADDYLMVSAKGGKNYEVCVPGLDNLSCTVYNLQGAAVASASTDGDTIDLDASALTDGIYVLSVNAAGQQLSRKLVIR